MRIFLLMGVLSLVFPSSNTVGAAEKRGDYGAPYFCPIFSVMPIGGDYLYYCDKFDPTCQSPAVAAYLIDNMPIPYVNCPEDCRESRRTKDQLVSTKSAFDGLPAKVPLDYMHEPAKASPIGVPPAKVGVSVNRDRDCHFVKFRYRGQPVWAKVIETRMNRPLAQGGEGLTDKEIDGSWVSYYVAFEVDKDPATENYRVHSVMHLTPLDGPRGYAFRGRVEQAIGKSVPVLIFLAKRP